jgi:hypothetical protein
MNKQENKGKTNTTWKVKRCNERRRKADKHKNK